jgi:hypothetical protein
MVAVGRGPRILRTTVMTLGLIALAGAALWQVFARTYDPELKNAYFGFGGAPRRGHALVYGEGRVFEVRLDVTNRGRRPITVTGVSWPGVGDDSFVDLVSIRMARRVSTNLGPRVPFAAFVLEPDQGRFLWIHLRFEGCIGSTPRDAAGLGDPLIHYRFLGVEGSTELNLIGRVKLVVPATCP